MGKKWVARIHCSGVLTRLSIPSWYQDPRNCPGLALQPSFWVYEKFNNFTINVLSPYDSVSFLVANKDLKRHSTLDSYKISKAPLKHDSILPLKNFKWPTSCHYYNLLQVDFSGFSSFRSNLHFWTSFSPKALHLFISATLSTWNAVRQTPSLSVNFIHPNRLQLFLPLDVNSYRFY